MLTDRFDRAVLSHLPTPLEPLGNLSQALSGPSIWIKRDDCTGLAMGGNKARQLEYYLGDAVAKGADTILTTGAVQSNHVRMTIAAARKLGLDVEVQLEHRVSGRQQAYRESGNPFLMKLMSAVIHEYPEGEDEAGADQALYDLADALRAEGKHPYVVPLSGNHTPYGALGYVRCAEELLGQFDDLELNVDGIVLATGSATTHAGLLSGLRACGSAVPVFGFCVRRVQQLQYRRVLDKCKVVSRMIEHDGCVSEEDIKVDDTTFHPGYGQLNQYTVEAIKLTALHEGIILDPTYTGKSMGGLIEMVRRGAFAHGDTVVYLHTGGAPGLFGYPELLEHENWS